MFNSSTRISLIIGLLCLWFAGLYNLSFGQQTTQMKVDSLLALAEYTQDFGGYSVGILTPLGEIYTGGNGIYNLGIGANDNDTTKFGLADLSQHLMAVLTLKLVEDGSISLSDQIGANVLLAAPLTAVPPSTTIEQLLRHTSGIKDFSQSPNYFNNALSIVFQDLSFGFETLNYQPITSQYLSSQGAANASGTFSYSLTNYMVLGEKLEQQFSGQTIQDLLNTNILAPAGVDSILIYNVGRQQPSGVEAGFTYNLSGVLPEILSFQTSVLTSTGASASIISNPQDFLTYAKALFGGQILNQNSLNLLLDFQPAAGREINGVQVDGYSYGTEQFQLDVAGQQESVIGHYGGVNYNTLFAYSQTLNAGVFISHNWHESDTANLVELAGKLLEVAKDDMVMSIEDELATQVTLSPNPAQSELTVQWDLNLVGEVKIEVYDLQGNRVVSTRSIANQPVSVNVESLSTGLYILKMETNRGTFTRKFIKE
ncbi:MAG: serine hydrolase [Bacteroidota bacterium]